MEYCLGRKIVAVIAPNVTASIVAIAQEIITGDDFCFKQKDYNIN